ncbi:organic cation transporter protein-like [Pollicipes pollicipes]|uniref:organic cation transporter protein-like n=1 Tax=Pollicipes pollicipes TaxID=41117 RepID=UPI0018855DB6|nr:organic cation transporter protein-like [Pollicipes pollicipes]
MSAPLRPGAAPPFQSSRCCQRRSVTMDQKAPVKFEQILSLVGDAGRWQFVIFLWSVVGAMLCASHNMSSIFIGAVPEHRCWLPAGANPELWLPRDNASGKLESCRRLVAPGANSTLPCDGWVYTDVEQAPTIVSEWDLVCERRWLLSTVQASYMFGIFCGALITGVISDQFGRKLAVCGSGVAFLVSGVAAAFAQSYAAFVVLRFVLAMAGAGVFGCMFILLLELVGPRWRALIGLVYQVPFAFGVMALPGVAYALRNWRHLQLAISVPAVLMMLFWWVVPESPRWLIMQGRLDEALAVLRGAARRNRRPLPGDAQLRQLMEQFRAAEMQLAGTELAARSPLRSCAAGVCEMTHLLRTPRMRRISLSCFYNWLIVSMIYYGVSFDSAKLSSSPYLAIFLAGLVEVPACLLSVPLINWIGRRFSMVGTHLFTGAAILCIMAVPVALEWPKLVLGMCGKFSASAAFGIAYLYTAELFPTTLRNAGFGASSTCARVGSMSAPYIVDLLGPVHWAVPSCVFGLCAVTAALVALMLPETNGRRLPETVADVERDGREPVPAVALPLAPIGDESWPARGRQTRSRLAHADAPRAPSDGPGRHVTHRAHALIDHSDRKGYRQPMS